VSDTANLAQHRARHSWVLPPGEFNSMIPMLLRICREGFMRQLRRFPVMLQR